jgi:hypothetical protein
VEALEESVFEYESHLHICYRSDMTTRYRNISLPITQNTFQQVALHSTAAVYRDLSASHALQEALHDLPKFRLQLDLVHLMARPFHYPELHLHLRPGVFLLVLVSGTFPLFELFSRGRLGPGETAVFAGKEEEQGGVRREFAKGL